MPDPQTTPIQAVDSFAREQVSGLRGEFHEFRDEVKQDVGQVRAEIGNGFSKVFSRMDADSRDNVRSAKSGIGVIASCSLGLVGLTFTFTTLITQPLRDQDRRHTEEVDSLRAAQQRHSERDGELRYEFGKVQVLTQTNAADLNRVEDDVKHAADKATLNAERLSKIEGKIEK